MSWFQKIREDRAAGPRRTAAVAVVALAAGVVLAGCGNDDDATDDAATASGEQVTVEIVSVGEAYDPASTTVAAGSDITWVNIDGTAHTATAEDGTWDSGDLDEGDEFTFTADQPGTFEYVCTIHPSMTGELIVE